MKDSLAQAQQEMAVAKVTLEHTQTENESLHTQLLAAQHTISRLNSEPKQSQPD